MAGSCVQRRQACLTVGPTVGESHESLHDAQLHDEAVIRWGSIAQPGEDVSQAHALPAQCSGLLFEGLHIRRFSPSFNEAVKTFELPQTCRLLPVIRNPVAKVGRQADGLAQIPHTAGAAQVRQTPRLSGQWNLVGELAVKSVH